MSMKDKIRAHYEHRITPERPNFDVLDWASAKSQEVRFRVLTECVELSSKSILDVGCGLGDLWTFLDGRGIACDYTGVDILEPMVRAAALRCPDARFVQADVFADEPFEQGSFDVAFCSGALNLNLGNNRRFLPQAVERMLRYCREAAVVNLLHARCRIEDDTYFSYEPADVRSLLGDLPCEIRIIDDYLPNDFTVLCRPK